MTRPELTVVIPVYNRAALVGRTLDSVAAQDVRPLALILVDNNSTDGTPDVLTRWAAGHRAPDFEITVISEKTPGGAAARNAGLREVDTEWTMFFDSDDTMLPGHIRRALAVVHSHPEAAVVGWNLSHRGLDGSAAVKHFHVDRPRWHNLFHGSMSTLRYMARTELFRRAGCWNSSLGTWDDIELGDRLLRLNPVCVHAGSEITVDVEAQAASITGATWSETAPKALASLAHFDPAPQMQRCARLKAMILCADCAREGWPEAARLRRQIIAREPSRLRRLLLGAAFHYRRIGLRGIARLLYPWFNLSE